MTMRLSEAIREGCKYSAKVNGTRHSQNGDACALGAAEDAVRGRKGAWPSFEQSVESLWPWAVTHKEPLPVDYGGGRYTIGNLLPVVTCIAALNNKTDLSREAIAEYVEVIERKLGLWDPPAVESTPAAPLAVKEREEVKA